MTHARPALVALLLCSIASTAQAWGELGHRLVGRLAERALTPEAKAQVAEILKGEPDPTLGGVATWADAMRGEDPERFRATSAWHYVNTPEGTCQYNAKRDCRNGACVIGAIEAQKRILADRKQSMKARREALKFIVHFVGDIHQPLHANNHDDQGGNKFQISLRTDIEPEAYARANYSGGVMGTNLHSIWDYYVLASAKLGVGEYAHRLTPKTPYVDDGTGPQAWAAESCELIANLSIYPVRAKMDGVYLKRMRPHAEQRVQLAGQRLAAMLNTLFATPTKAN